MRGLPTPVAGAYWTSAAIPDHLPPGILERKALVRSGSGPCVPERFGGSAPDAPGSQAPTTFLEWPSVKENPARHRARLQPENPVTEFHSVAGEMSWSWTLAVQD